jgi:DNA-binding transcriptional LysR family regulator
LLRVLPRYRFDGGGTYLVWPSRRFVPPRVVAVREFLFDSLRKVLV